VVRTELRIVDNRVFVLGLDELYRSAIKRHESSTLLDCARQLASDLSIAPAEVPVEGYYTEDKSLTEYFRLMRALQGEDDSRERDIRHDKAYRRLKDVTESPIYGSPVESERLIKKSRDVLYAALETTSDDRTIDAIASAAYKLAIDSDEYSLVALGALTRDAVVLTALRESVVLYADVPCFGLPPEEKYKWLVDPVVAERAQYFVDSFNKLFEESLPSPHHKNAKAYWRAYDRQDIAGRCIRIAFDDRVSPVNHYHWAIDQNERGELSASDFWDTKIWTTEQYRKRNGHLR
jgi:hypothetical protein